MALLHKGLEFETIPWCFTDKEAIAPSGSTRVPVVVDGDKWIADSWQIALYLDATYPERPLMRAQTTRGLSQFVNSWCDRSVLKALSPFALRQVAAVAHDKDKDYFRTTREARLGMTLEEFCNDQAAARDALQSVLAPAEHELSSRDFLGGSSPCYGDYALFGSIKWVHSVSGAVPLANDSAIRSWFERMLDLFNGYARKAPTAGAG
jgi:glutathione S-transferase